MSELKACPFCGGKAVIIFDEDSDYCFLIKCSGGIKMTPSDECIGEGMDFWFPSKAPAVAAWNNRVKEPILCPCDFCQGLPTPQTPEVADEDN